MQTLIKIYNRKYFALLLFSLPFLINSCSVPGNNSVDGNPTLLATNSIASSLASNLKVDLVSAGVDEESAATITDTALSASLAGSLQQKIAMKMLAAESAQTSLYQQVATKFIEGAMKGIAKTNLSAEQKQTAAGINAYTPIRSMAASATDLSETERKAAVEAISNQAVAKLQETGLDTNELAIAISNIGEKSVKGVSQTGVSAEEARELVQSAAGGATKGLTNLTEISAADAQNFSSDLAEGSVRGIANFSIEGVQTTELVADVTTGLNEGLATVESQINGFDISTATAGIDTSIYNIAKSNLGLTATEIDTAIKNGKNAVVLYKIMYDANGGTGSMTNLSIAKGSAANLTANTFTRANYAFAGWATSSGATSAAYNDGASYTMGNADVTLYAVWIISEYEVTFNANGGTGTMSNQGFTAFQTANLSSNTFTRAGYVFAGWATSSGATSAAYNDGASYTMGNANVTLYAVWESPTYEVYLPPITAYIFPEAMPKNLPFMCNTSNCTFDGERFSTPEAVVKAIFASGQGSSNYFTKQIMVANRVAVNDLQIVYVKTDATVTSTTSFSALDSQTFTLTDALGTADKGTINHAENRIRIVFTGSFTCGGVSAAGCASVNSSNTIKSPHNGLIVINMNASSLLSISETIAHQFGHFFGLLHTFSSPPTSGCETIAQGTTNFIMDYATNSTTFQGCEIAFVKTILEASPFSKGIYKEDPVTNSAKLFALESTNTKTQLENRVQVLKGNWQGKLTIGEAGNYSGLNVRIPSTQ